MSAVLEAPPVADVVHEVAPTAAVETLAGTTRDLLELPEVRARVWRMPVELCERLILEGLLPVKSELIHGVLIEKMSKSPLHEDLLKWIYDHFQTASPAGCVVRSECTLRIGGSLPEPDVSVVRGDRRSLRRARPTTAELVVEVAVSTLAADRRMAFLYAQAEVAEYWIVAGEEEFVEVYRRPENGVYQETRRFTRGETLACERVPELRVVLDELFG